MTERYREDVTISGNRLNWPSIVGGSVLALSLFVLSGVLARAVGLDYTFRNAMTTGQQIVTVIWGAISALICFGIGGAFAAQTATGSNRKFMMYNGLLVWALTIPLLVYIFGAGVGPMVGENIAPSQGGAVQAGARFEGGTLGEARVADHSQAAAWWMLVSLVLGLIAATYAAAGVDKGIKTTHERGSGI